MKRKKAGSLLAVLAILLILTGCGTVDRVRGSIQEILVDRQTKIYSEQFDSITEEEKECAEELVADGDYAFSQLPEEEQDLYLEILSSIVSFEEEKRLSSMDPDQVDLVYRSIMMDHPELFYLEGYTITKHMIAERTVFYTFTGQYNRSMEESQETMRRIDEKAEQILAQIPENSSDYEKEKFVYEYIVRNTVYDEASEDNQNIISVFMNQASVCQGYSYAAQYLLKKLEIPCTTVTGTVINRDGHEVSHAWNMVCLDGEYYYMDTTWGDPIVGSTEEAAQWMGDTYVNYDYLNLTTEQISKDHTAAVPVPLPECSSSEYNYYRAEGLLYETYDSELLMRKTEEAETSGKRYLVMKFPDADIYEEYRKRLFEEQEIFQIIPKAGSVSYTGDLESCLLIIHLSDR